MQGQVDEALLLHPSLHPVCEGPEMDSVLVEGQEEDVAFLVVEAEACGEGEGHHKMALEVV